MPAVPRPRSRVLRSMLSLVALASLGGCGAASEPGPDAASNPVDGPWVVESVELTSASGPHASDIATTITEETDEVVFDEVAVSIEATTGCRRIFGSYTLVVTSIAGDSGVASFTVPGASTGDCPAEDDLAAALLTALLEQVERWHREGRLLVFEGPEGRLGLLPAG